MLFLYQCHYMKFVVVFCSCTIVDNFNKKKKREFLQKLGENRTRNIFMLGHKTWILSSTENSYIYTVCCHLVVWKLIMHSHYWDHFLFILFFHISFCNFCDISTIYHNFQFILGIPVMTFVTPDFIFFVLFTFDFSHGKLMELFFPQYP